MYTEGLARLATSKYSKPKKNNINKLTMHLTNYAINKKNPKFVFNEHEEDDDVGHKRSFTSILKVKLINKLY
jgi:tubulin polyglutamylase TTLL6/13